MAFLRVFCEVTAAIHGTIDLASSPSLKKLSTGERPFTDILSSLRYWVIHSITLPALFLAGWFLVASGLAPEIFIGETTLHVAMLIAVA